MMRSMEAFRRQLSTRSVAPVLAIIVTVHSPIDPNRRASGTGYGGVLTVPIPAAPTATVARMDSLLDAHRDARTERGRVLYATGHDPRATTPSAKTRKQCPSPERRLVQGRGSSSPNS
jgi:hypothetical protein